MHHRRSRVIAFVLVLFFLILAFAFSHLPSSAQARAIDSPAGVSAPGPNAPKNGTVTDCSSQTDLESKLAGGGIVTFGCSGTIPITVTLAITAPTTINGAGQSVTLDGGNARRIISATVGAGVLTLQNITLTRGLVNCCTGVERNGGALFVRDALVLSNTIIMSSTSVTGAGGGAYVEYTLTMTGSRFISNRAATSGGGAHIENTATLNGGLFQNNRASSGVGGGLNTVTTLVMSGTQFINNRAAGGGGAFANGAAILTNGLFQENDSTNAGGGLYAIYTLDLTGTQFISNTANDAGGGAYNGSGTTLNRGLFQHNQSANGGGLFASGTLVFTGTQFISNSAKDSGGGAYVLGAATLNNGLFQQNTVTSTTALGGGLAIIGPLAVTGTQFISNTANKNGGGAYAQGISTLRDAQFIGNQALTEDGAGLYTYDALTLINGLFVNNQSTNNNGGGLYANGTSAVIGTRFINNSALFYGGGLHANNALALTGTLFIGNAVSWPTSRGGGFYISAGAGRIVNSLFARNSAADGAGLYWDSGGSAQILHSTIASPGLAGSSAIHVAAGTVGITNTIVTSHSVGINRTGGTVYENYNLFFGNTTDKSGTIGGGANDVSGNPLFVDTAADDYHLNVNSPAIDAGVNAGVTTDIDGQPRPIVGYDIGFDEALARLLLPVILR